MSPGVDNAPVVLIVPGSGPTNRDGNSLHGLNTDTYKLLAQGLAARGIASVRIDKRGMFSSSCGDPQCQQSDHRRLCERCARLGQGHPRQDRRQVHLGARPQRGRARRDGRGEGQPARYLRLVLVAAPGRKFGELIKDQLRSNPANAPFLDEALRDIDTLEAGKHVEVSIEHTRPEIL